MQQHLLGNIKLTGGNCKIPGFLERIVSDLESLKPIDCQVNVSYVGEEEITSDEELLFGSQPNKRDRYPPDQDAWRGL